MNAPRIVVLDGHTLNPGDNPWSELEKLGDLSVYDRTAADDFLSRTQFAEILLTNKTPIKLEQMVQLPHLKFIGVLATGYNVVDVAAAGERGIVVSNVPSYGTDSVAQHVLALILELCNHVADHARSVARGDWGRCPDFCYWRSPVQELQGLSLGIVGWGRIGRRVAAVGRSLGMNLLYTSRSAQGAEGARRLSLEELFSAADVISLHCSQTPENFQFVNRELLRHMKPTAYLINTARGTLINETDLAHALREGWIGGAGLDVLSAEPPSESNPLLSAPRCLITPHIAWSGRNARRRLLAATVENVRAFLAGQPINRVG